MSLQEVKIPDIGDADSIEVIELCVAPGDQVMLEDSLIVLESEKATIEVPSPIEGKVKEFKLVVGDKVTEGDLILMMESQSQSEGVTSSSPEPSNTNSSKTTPSSQQPVAEAAEDVVSKPSVSKASASKTTVSKTTVSKTMASKVSSVTRPDKAKVHAGPAVRRLASELGVDLANVPGTGPKQRILKDDVHSYVKTQFSTNGSNQTASASGGGLPALPEMDFSKYGDIETIALSKIQKVSARNLHRSWVHVPHVTQFDEADITEMEAFRKSQSEQMKNEGVKLTPLAFMVKAVAYCLGQFPRFNSSLHRDGETLILKQYCHVGIAVDTSNGLVVPVIKNADRLSLVDIAKELRSLSEKARDKKLMPKDMQGACFTISSLGGIGGTAFTPVVNWPEVAILGVSRANMKPVYDGDTDKFVPRLMLPLSLSYDHRVIDGAEAARFTTYLAQVLGDIRKLLL
ncbi:MAG: dihydrolipoyllysine-residue acetyltransferase [Pseudomonadales bacterium]|nr:dihydrolipoyllysine-residue acetyltransferase [Pseudomonadales bacterium]